MHDLLQALRGQFFVDRQPLSQQRAAATAELRGALGMAPEAAALYKGLAAAPLRQLDAALEGGGACASSLFFERATGRTAAGLPPKASITSFLPNLRKPQSRAVSPTALFAVESHTVIEERASSQSPRSE